jgi:hypothetical protein
VTRGIIAAATLAVLLGGCGEDNEPRSDPTPAPKPPTSAPKAPTSAITSGGKPPPGVERQIQYHGAGDSICPNLESRVPRVRVDKRPLYQNQQGGADPKRPEIGEFLYVCPRGFAPGGVIDVEIHPPKGPVIKRRVDPAVAGEYGLHVEHFLTPQSPLGRYRVIARQAGETAEGSVEVVKPTHFGARAGRQTVKPGESLPVVFVGARPNETLMIDVYEPQPNYSSRYASSFSMRVNAEGIGFTMLRTDPRGNTGFYLLKPRHVDQERDQDAFGTFAVCKRDPCEEPG